MGAPSSSCSSITPSDCQCDFDAGSYTLTENYTYCQDEFNQYNCCNQMGNNYADYNQTYKAFNCFTPNATIIAQNSTLCDDPNSWVQPLTCPPVFGLYRTLGFLESEWIGDPLSCCGQNGITCDFKNHVTGIDWSSKNKAGKRLLADVFVEMNGLKSLSLSGNMLYGSIPASITNLVSLEYLNLSHNAFTGPIAEIQFTKLSNMQVLDISYNKLGDSVPNTLANLTNLKDLSIGNNRFSGSIPNNLLSRNVTVKYTQYNSSKPTEAAIVNIRRRKFQKFMLKSRDVFDQAAIASVGEIQFMCPKPYSRALTNLYRSYLEINQNASSAIENMNTFVSSKATATQVKKTLIAAFKVGIFASSIFCKGKRILGYNGLYGPQRWNIEYPSCAYPNQSPVNFETEGSELYENFTNSTLALYSSVIAVNSVLAHENTSIATQKKVSIYIQDPLARLQIGENIYSLFLTEIHTSSEHRIDGKDFVAEAQFYFRKESPESIKAKLSNSPIYYPDAPYYGNQPIYYPDASYYGNNSSYYGDQGANYSGNYSSYYGDQGANYSGNYSSYYGDQGANYSGNYSSYYSNFSYTEANSSFSMPFNYSSYYKMMFEYSAEYAQNMSISLRDTAQSFSNFTKYAMDSSEFYYANYSYNYYTNLANSFSYTSSYYRNLSGLAPTDLIQAMSNSSGAGIYSVQDQMQSGPILPSAPPTPTGVDNGPGNSSPTLYPSGPGQECFSEYGKYYDACKVRFNGAFMKDTEQPDEIVAIGALVGIEDESSDFISQVANAYSSPYSLFKLDYSSVFSKIQNSSSFYSYKGSYTSPPCYKNVNWLVSTSELLTISVEDLKKIQQVQGYNSRETQPFGPGRESDIFNKK